ncbi:peroxide stress protein YaaA [Phenylobacterium sp.]|uniref:peroxide stress protein YaaA n=1 Tax=Phenylobacterium sp. TaxID=1871053 RepID=UPI0035B2AB00
MLLVLSPAKALDFTPPETLAPLSAPQMSKDVAELAKVTRKLTARELKGLMSLSDNLAALAHERFQAFDPKSPDGLQAAFAFNGDVYMGLQARTLDASALEWAQDHVRILSGLYGVLRPMDVIQPYRLEMGSRVRTRRGSSLYDFWGDRIAKVLNEAAAGHADRTLVNVASGEYFGAVDRRALKLPVLTIRFLEEKDGEARIVSFFAKRARGLMARYAIDNRIDRVDGLKDFDLAGYSYQPSRSSGDEWTFARRQPVPAAA